MSGMRSIDLTTFPPLLAQLPLKYAALAAIGVTTGCRISEILALRRFDLLTARGELKNEISFIKLKSQTRKEKNTFRAAGGTSQKSTHLRRGYGGQADTAALSSGARRAKGKPGCAGDFKGERHRKLGIPTRYREIVLRYLQHEEQRGYDRPDDWVFPGNQGNHLSRLTVYRFFRAVLGAGYGTHWMRKTFAQEIYKHFVAQNAKDPMRALELTRRAIGHVEIDTTVKYLGIDDRALADAQNAIFNGETK